MKKCFALILSLVLSISAVSPAFAGVEDRAYFLKALKATVDEFNKETALAEKADKSSALLKQLLNKFPFETLVEAGFTSDNDVLKDYSNLSIKANAKYNLADSKHLMQLNMNIPKALTGSGKKIEMDMSTYSDGNQVAFNLPKVSDKYYAIPQTATTDKWNNSAIGQLIPMDEDIVELLLYIFGEYPLNTMEMVPSLSDKETIKDMTAPYSAIFKSFLSKGTFRSESGSVLDTSIGQIAVKKTSATYTRDQLEEYLYATIDQLMNDEFIRAYLNAIYGSMNEEMGIDMTEAYLESIAYMLDSIVLPEQLTYMIYTNKADKILRHEISFLGAFGEETSITLDTIGQPYLLDEVYFTYRQQDMDTTTSVKMSVVGNYVPADGVFKSDVSLKVFNEVKGRYNMDVMDLLRASYQLDMNKSADNLKMQMNIGRFGERYSVEKPYDVNISINGDYVVDTANKALIVNLKDIHMQYDEYEMDMYLNVNYRAINADDVSVPADQLIDLLDLTEEEAMGTQKELTRFFEIFK